MLRFSAENNAFPALPAFSSTPFSDAWEAEVALVRMTVPCIEIKVLKHGGTLSKTHSVRLYCGHTVCAVVQCCSDIRLSQRTLGKRSAWPHGDTL